MTDCKLIATCPYFNDESYGPRELSEGLKQEYCHGNYRCCGRYLSYETSEGEKERENPESAAKMG